MKHINLKCLFILLAFAIVLTSCSKERVQPIPDTPEAERAGLYILNQGGIGHNNSTLTYYDYGAKKLTSDIFTAANTEKLGDTGNDLGIYGSKMFIAVNNSDLVDVTDARTVKLIKKISIAQPRSVVFYKSNAFVTSYSGTVSVIDTASLAIIKTITVGRNPEQMVVTNGKLYVANSGGLDYPNFDKTVSVINLATLTESKKIDVTDNPITITADAHGNVYVLSAGNYNDVPGGITIINSATDAVTLQNELSLGYNLPIAAYGDYVYYPTADNKIAMYNAKTQKPQRANFITDGTVITSPYAITIDSQTGEVFIADAKDYSSNGAVTAFDKTGKKEYTIETGVSPGRITLVNK